MYQDHSLGYGKRNSRSSMFRIVPKFKKEKAAKKTSPQSGRAVTSSASVLNRQTISHLSRLTSGDFMGNIHTAASVQHGVYWVLFNGMVAANPDTVRLKLFYL